LSLLNVVAVFLGAGLGGLGRYLLNLALVQPAWLPFALGTLTVNVVGGFAAGALFGWLGPEWLRTHPAGLFLMTGVLGGLTTFSAFTAEGASLLLDRPLLALAHATVHVLFCLAAFLLASRLFALN
jgi:fluoride exporter